MLLTWIYDPIKKNIQLDIKYAHEQHVLNILDKHKYIMLW